MHACMDGVVQSIQLASLVYTQAGGCMLAGHDQHIYTVMLKKQDKVNTI